MLITPKLYSNQFKADVVTLVDPGIARRKMCADSRALVLAKWTNEARLESFGMGPSVDAQTNKHISATLHRIIEIEKENEVLRAEAAYSFQEVIHPKESSRPTQGNHLAASHAQPYGSGAGVFTSGLPQVALSPV